MPPTTAMPMLDKVLLDPSCSGSGSTGVARPLTQSPRRVFGSQPTPGAPIPPRSLSMHNTEHTNRPVKRSNTSMRARPPERQPQAGTATYTDVAPTSSRLHIMGSPPQLAQNPFKPSKRALEATPSGTEGSRPSKRASNTAATSREAGFTDLTTSKGASLLGNAVPTKPRTSGSFQGRLASSTVSATRTIHNNRADWQLFVPPSVPTLGETVKYTTSKPNAQEGDQAVCSATPISGPAYTPSCTPSKFGLTYAKPPQPSPRPLAESQRLALPGDALSVATLAPSAIRADEHVPRPLSEPVPILPSKMSRSSSSNSLNASPGRVQAVFGNPFLDLTTQQGRAHLSTAMLIPSSPPPSIDAQNPATITAQASTSEPKLASHIIRGDFMCRTIENNDSMLGTSKSKRSRVSKEVGHVRLTDMTGLPHPLQATDRFSPSRPACESYGAVTSRAPGRDEASRNATSALTFASTSSPHKRPLSPAADSSSMGKHRAHARSRGYDELCRDDRALSRRQSSSRTTRTSLANSKNSLPQVQAANDIDQSRKSIKELIKDRPATSVTERAVLQYRAASAGGSPPITRPLSHRSTSAPTVILQDPVINDTVFDAPAAPAPFPARKCTSANTSVDEGDSGGILDADTSVMSSSALSSLANLQGLISRMSRPSISRRTSSAFPSLSSLPESSEADLKIQPSLANKTKPFDLGQCMNGTSHNALPRYAAPTSSSAARRSGGSKGPESTIAAEPHSSASPAREPRRRVSYGVPEFCRGSLLPVAVTAAQRLTVRPDSAGVEATEKNPAMQAAKIEKPKILKDVVAFVDVKTAEGDEAGGVFVDILRSLGARVLARPTDSITHIIFKGGRQATVQRYRAYTKEPKPFFVGVGWIVRCRETNERADESPFLVNPDSVDNGVLLSAGAGQPKSVQPLGVSSGNVSKGSYAKRRKTLEPKVLFPDPKKPSGPLVRGQQTLHSFAVFRGGDNPQTSSHSLGDLERARQRSLKFAPKIGSPLKQKAFNAIEHDEDTREKDA